MPDEYFNVTIVGAGLVESIVAAALSRVGYSVLQVDDAEAYGGPWASVSLSSVHDWAEKVGARVHGEAPDGAHARSERFSLSLAPMLVSANGAMIEAIRSSRVHAYSQFHELCSISYSGDAARPAFVRVPTSRADIFSSTRMSLVEKRRITKVIQSVMGSETHALGAGAESPLDSSDAFAAVLQNAFRLSPGMCSEVTHALALARLGDPSAPVAARLRLLLQGCGRFCELPYLVGHYGGAGDLVAAFARMSAVWGGAQIVGHRLVEIATVQGGNSSTGNSPEDAGKSSTDQVPTNQAQFRLTVDIAGELLSFTTSHIIRGQSSSGTVLSSAAHAIVVIPADKKLKAPQQPRETDAAPDAAHDDTSTPDSPNGSTADSPERTWADLFVISPESPSDAPVLVTQVDHITFSCPEGYAVAYIQQAHAQPTDDHGVAETQLAPVVDALFPERLLVVYHVARAHEAAATGADETAVGPVPDWSQGSVVFEGLNEAVDEAHRIFRSVAGDAAFFPVDSTDEDREDI